MRTSTVDSPGSEPARARVRKVSSTYGARFRPERTFLPLVARERLVERLTASRPPLVICSAGAGWGKSTLLAQWTAADPRPTAWLRLEPADDDLPRLLADLGQALEHVAPVEPADLALLRSRRPPVTGRILPGFARALETAPPFLLVLDDAHAVGAPECWAVLRALVDEAADGTSIAIGSRTELPIDLDRLRAAGAVLEIPSAELGLDRDELVSLLELRQIPIATHEVDELLRLTEGWPAGVTLVLLTAAEGRGEAFTAWDSGVIASYLAAEVLDRQEPRMRDFLLRTAVLERLSAKLCEAVTGDSEAARLLDACVRRNVFLSGLDDEDTWFRCHPLFRDLLRKELDRRLPGEVDALQRRAATWFATNGHPEEAVDHWLAVDDTDAAVDLVVAACDAYLVAGEPWRARELLERIPESEILSRPSLTLAAGWVFASCGTEQQMQRWGAAAAVADVGEEPSPDGACTRRSSQLLLRATLALEGITQMRRDAETGAALEDERPGSWRTFALLRLGMARYLDGDPAGARGPLERVLVAGEPAERAAALGYLALIAADEGRWEETARAVRAIVDAVPTIETGEIPDLCDLAAPLALARARAHAGEPGALPLVDAVACQYDARPRLPRSSLFAAVLLAELSLALGEPERLRFWAGRALHALRDYPDAGILRARADRVIAAATGLDRLERITPAEARVLALLPTHLSHREIGEQLFVSTNTVRTHLRHLYAKLDVTTRADAVARAEELGLLPRRRDRRPPGSPHPCDAAEEPDALPRRRVRARATYDAPRRASDPSVTGQSTTAVPPSRAPSRRGRVMTKRSVASPPRLR